MVQNIKPKSDLIIDYPSNVEKSTTHVSCLILATHQYLRNFFPLFFSRAEQYVIHQSVTFPQ